MTAYRITTLTREGHENIHYTTREEAERAINNINTIAKKAKATNIRAYADLYYRWAGCLKTITL